MKKKMSIFLGFAVGMFFMYLAFKDIEYERLVSLYSRVNSLYLVPCLLIIFAELFLRGVKWKMLLDPSGKISFLDSFRLETIGLALNNVLPLRIGEVVRAFWCSRLRNIPVVTVFSTIFIERVLDAMLIFVLFMAAVRMDPLSGAVSAFGDYFLPVLSILMVGMIFLIFIDEIISHKWLSGFFASYAKVYKFLKEIAFGVKGFRKPLSASGIILTGLVQWSLDALNVYIIAAAFGLNGVLSFYKSVMLLFAGAVAASIPSMPGFFGNYEYSLTKVMGLWNIEANVAFAFASYLHLAFYIAVTAAGLVFIYQMGWSLGKIWRKFKNAKK